MLNKILCYFNQHKFRVIQILEPQKVIRVHCDRCSKDWAVHRDFGLVLWDKDLEEMYRAFGNRIISPVYTDGSPTYNFENLRKG